MPTFLHIIILIIGMTWASIASKGKEKIMELLNNFLYSLIPIFVAIDAALDCFLHSLCLRRDL